MSLVIVSGDNDSPRRYRLCKLPTGAFASTVKMRSSFDLTPASGALEFDVTTTLSLRALEHRRSRRAQSPTGSPLPTLDGEREESPEQQDTLGEIVKIQRKLLHFALQFADRQACLGAGRLAAPSKHVLEQAVSQQAVRNEILNFQRKLLVYVEQLRHGTKRAAGLQAISTDGSTRKQENGPPATIQRGPPCIECKWASFVQSHYPRQCQRRDKYWRIERVGRAVCSQFVRASSCSDSVPFSRVH
jgi:hypothetical protein